MTQGTSRRAGEHRRRLRPQCRDRGYRRRAPARRSMPSTRSTSTRTPFPVGMCTRTLFGKAEIVLWRMRADAWRIEVWRSFAPYVLGCLEEACLDIGYERRRWDFALNENASRDPSPERGGGTAAKRRWVGSLNHRTPPCPSCTARPAFIRSVVTLHRRTPPTALRAVPPPRSGEGWRLFVHRQCRCAGAKRGAPVAWSASFRFSESESYCQTFGVSVSFLSSPALLQKSLGLALPSARSSP